MVKYLDRHLKQLTAVIENWKNIGKFHNSFSKLAYKFIKLGCCPQSMEFEQGKENNLALKCNLMDTKNYCINIVMEHKFENPVLCVFYSVL